MENNISEVINKRKASFTSYIEESKRTICEEGIIKFIKKANLLLHSKLIGWNVFVILKKIVYGYYIKNRIECKKNMVLLKKARDNLKYDLKKENPRVSVLIPTYNIGKVLTERAIPSVLRQAYQNFEIIIVGDHCTDNTEELIKNFNDERIKFYNLPKRGEYPTNPLYRRMVAGSVPANKAIELCSGDWIAPLDDDDEFSEDHVETLLNYALEHNYEMVYGKIILELERGGSIEVGCYPLKSGGICRISALYHSRLKFFKYDVNSWRYNEGGDWNMWRRMKEANVRMSFINKIVGKHYIEKSRAA